MSIIDLLSKNEAKRRKAVEGILNKAGQVALDTTAPFRKGANILAQNYASAFMGKDMSQSDNQGAFLKYLAGAITPEEQKQISEKPFLEAIKSSAGMTSSLMPFTKIGNVAKVGSKIANPAISKLAQLATRGSIEGTAGGFGYSRPGKELQDTLLGTFIGAGGEVAGGLISDPAFRKGIGKEIKKANTGKYSGELNLGDEGNVIKLYDAEGENRSLLKAAGDYDSADEFINNMKNLYDGSVKDLRSIWESVHSKGNWANLLNEKIVEGERGAVLLETGADPLPKRKIKVKGGKEFIPDMVKRIRNNPNGGERIPISSWDEARMKSLKKKRGKL